MSTTQPGPEDAWLGDNNVEERDAPEEPEYHTASGVTVEISDIEVDVVDVGEEEVVSSQADPEAYGIEPGRGGEPSTPLDTASA